jgi:hypothetical protein
MTCGTTYKLHTCIQAVLNVNCHQISETRHLITRLRISQNVQTFVFTTPRNKFPVSENFQLLQFLTTNRITIISYTCSRVFRPFSVFPLLIWDSDAVCVFFFQTFSYSTITAEHRSLHTLPSLTQHQRQVSGFAFRSSSKTDKVYSWYL